jgi:undecaprenyl-diphosphatase
VDVLQVVVLAIVQGAAELLPVSSSAHVIVAEKLMGLDPTAPQMTLLLVMLHTGTMFAVIVYFWKSWQATFFASRVALRVNATRIVLATAVTGLVGLVLLQLIKLIVAGGSPDFEIESLFGNARLMAAALAAAGVLIILSSRLSANDAELTLRRAAWIGAVQGLCLPFRGFSRSGATISTGIALGVSRRDAEEFSFALAVALTPAVIVKEAFRLLKLQPVSGAHSTALLELVGTSAMAMLMSFLAGLVALRWLSNWLETGRWYVFGVYCLVASAVVLWVG